MINVNCLKKNTPLIIFKEVWNEINPLLIRIRTVITAIFETLKELFSPHSFSPPLPKIDKISTSIKLDFNSSEATLIPNNSVISPLDKIKYIAKKWIVQKFLSLEVANMEESSLGILREAANNLSKIVKSRDEDSLLIIKENLLLIVDILFNRINQFLSVLPFTEIVDALVHEVIAEHVEAYIFADSKASKKSFLEAFSEHKGCHPIIKKIINNTFLNNSQLLLKAKEEISNTISQTLWNVCFPPEIFNDMWPKLMKDEKTKLVFSKIFPFFSSENDIKTQFETLIIYGIKTVVECLFDKFTHRQNLNEFVAESLFPSISEALTKEVVLEEFKDQLKIIAPFFMSILKFPDKKEEILKSLNLKFNDFFSHEVFTKEIAYCLNHIVKFLERENENKKDLSVDTVTTQLEDYFYPEKEKIEVDSIYGNILYNIAFTIGGWKAEPFIRYFIKSAISNKLSSIIHPFRSTYQPLIDFSFQYLKSKTERPGKALPKNKEEVSNRLQQEIGLISKLGYKILIKNAQKKGRIVNFGVKHVISNSSEKLNKLITLLYDKLGGKELLNGNLFIQVYQKIFESLEKIVLSEKVKRSQLN